MSGSNVTVWLVSIAKLRVVPTYTGYNEAGGLKLVLCAH